jgi:uncharacterized protein
VGSGADILAKAGDGESPLTLALRRGLPLLKVVVVAENVNRTDPEGNAPLRVVVDSKPAPEALDFILSAGAKVDARDRYADTALHAAMAAGNVDLAARLAKAGSDLFARDKAGETPVSLAMAKGVEALKALVTAAGIGSKDKLGNGLLHYAALAGNAEAAAWLASIGADKSLRNISGETASEVAAKRGKTELAEMLKPAK